MRWIEKLAISEEIEDMLERTRNNPNAIIYGTYHSYPVMQHLLSCCSNMMSGYATHKELGHTRPLVSKQSASNI
jgi:hypothetical protein